MFGPVLKSEKINVHQLKAILGKASERVMFGFKNGRVNILDKTRKAVFPSAAAIEHSDVFDQASQRTGDFQHPPD